MHIKQHYKTKEEALALVEDARAYQTKAWPSTKLANGGERPFEAQLALVEEYTLRLRKVWNETPGYIDDGSVPNVEGRKRVEKYAAIVANLALWMVQAATGEEVVQDFVEIPCDHESPCGYTHWKVAE
jgi:hypothetical protein